MMLSIPSVGRRHRLRGSMMLGEEMTDTDRLLSARDVAERLRVDIKTVGRWLLAGRLKGFKTPGHHWRVWESDLNKALEEAQEESWGT